jgi:hypothetical protein
MDNGVVVGVGGVRKRKVKEMKIVQMQMICGYGSSHKSDFAL